MKFFYIEYIYLIYSIITISIFSFILFFFIKKINFQQEKDIEKLLSYECGFEPFEDTRFIFDIKFYLIAILFIIFDLEIIFLFPWTIIIGILNKIGILSIIFFYFLLTLIYIYEWLLGAFTW